MFVLACLPVLVACAVGTERRFPLVAGAATRSAILRADIDEHRNGPPPVEFEVDCSALPYAKGEEREFCYEWGSWAVVELDRGILVACGCGEFGGFVAWYARGGGLLQTLITGDVPKTLIADSEALVCVTGLTHLNSSTGAVHGFRLVGERWQALGATALPKDVASVAIEADGSLRLDLHDSGGAFRYRTGTLEGL